jgi:hypothetical protein
MPWVLGCRGATQLVSLTSSSHCWNLQVLIEQPPTAPTALQNFEPPLCVLSAQRRRTQDVAKGCSREKSSFSICRIHQSDYNDRRMWRDARFCDQTMEHPSRNFSRKRQYISQASLLFTLLVQAQQCIGDCTVSSGLKSLDMLDVSLVVGRWSKFI